MTLSGFDVLGEEVQDEKTEEGFLAVLKEIVALARSFACSDLGTETIDGSASSRSILSYPTATLLIGWRGHLRPVLRLVSEPWPTKVSSA
jgi:hypothetical protein